ncbi:xylanase inhibitor protein 1 [Aegilops tauschii subsp. strangulata]|jgi:chitinase|uniref:Xylanase inhibitor protein 1 n=6 Tax=Triticinae TaxID=1648030 RepID=XIP1_WHEAT|nr:xylanase inhibitor protein 1 precursor [Triticum aestivum]XP_020156613.1 xylanase inhibitor protein 1 [Aegilops tauschii subsp. strangulata]Q8L5C6.2 RecName: Full=Xylanase inhibitor protein 1; Short=XIP-1; Short=XIP-I; AltName: Full=Class III chitinase homolog; Flags: Precursor [Triticum aestivum]AGN71004.1 xylanase inhibitor protein precursor [Triticum aestivum]
MAPLAARRPACLLALLSVAAALFLTPTALAAGGKTGQVTVFWGRNKAEGSLREACDSGMYTMVTMSFLDVFGANGKYHLDLSGHDLSSVGADIKHCQSKGVPVSLSIGGYGTGYSLPSNRSALDLFDHLWNSYFGGSKPSVPRPFGDAWLDGVDLFLEHGTPADRYDVLALELAKHNIRGGPGKPLHLTATVRCGYPPAAHVGRALATGIFERVHVRTYESDKWCNQNLGWEGSWDKWTAAYPATRFYVGLTADDKSHQWVHPKNVYYGVAPVAQKKDNYGGIMLWDRYFDKQTNYSSLIKYYA